ncbi:MAG TPA: TylF/MycF/NovP-related O-methyltransferase [Blastocatellia bacterium]|nr:TylF/MycF/NovP-related O-methyltransferase [Blastocatellia bacterium]
MLVKRIESRLELMKLRYYKRNPLEKSAFNLIKNIYEEEDGPLLLSFFSGKKPVLFDPGELLNIWQQARIMTNHGGVFAEVGVFRGTSAKVICEAKEKTPLHLFDTFEGLPDEISERDRRFEKGMFAGNENKVKERLSQYPDVVFYPGIFPGTAATAQNLKFSFVHLDVDLYKVTRKALEFFYPRMLPGGRILSHDYGHCEGVWCAFDEFIIGKQEKLQPMQNTQVLLIKSS